MAETVRVLLVDDDEDDCLITREILDEGVDTVFDVVAIGDAEKAIELLTSDADIDVALIDYGLGRLTGLDVLRAVREVGVDTPCILLTGQRNPATDQAALEMGAADYIVKGEFDGRTIERAIRYAVGRAADLRSLRRSEMRLRTVVEAANDGIILLDDDGIILGHNSALSRMYDVPADSLEQRSFMVLVRQDSGEALLARIEAEIATADVVRLGPIEATGVRDDGSEFPIEVSVASWRDDDGARLWSAIVRDVTERSLLAEQLRHQAFHDPLTDLANRALLRERVEMSLRALERTGGYVGVLLLDLDNFKMVNDTFGHDVGDELLSAVASRIEACVRPGDTVARLGGDEFAVCLPDVSDPTVLAALAERVLRAIRQPFDLASRSIETTCSLGLAVCDTGIEPDALLRDADVAMYAAKARGRNQFEVFEDSMHGALVERIQLEADLRAAHQRGELSVHYQPVFNLQTGRLQGFEALSRWCHPTRGPVSPAVFIAVAEESGFIRDLGRSVLRSAVAQTARWQRRFPREEPVSIAVNLSSRQLADPDLLEVVATALADNDLAPGTLVLEITESVMVGDVDHAVNLLTKLRELGVRLALDDFGTGYSSLSYLHLLPLDLVKVDRSFVNRIDDEGGAALVRAIVAMGDSLGLETVAEGVESVDQREFLRREGYTFGQGYLFARPLDAEAAEALLERLERENDRRARSDRREGTA